ncbi:MAG: hypothetical protein FJW26_18110 [Acidimicrobiia bacterium]|nr:hypothetical protein [Acidimicrobiia bacterium]
MPSTLISGSIEGTRWLAKPQQAGGGPHWRAVLRAPGWLPFVVKRMNASLGIEHASGGEAVASQAA